MGIPVSMSFFKFPIGIISSGFVIGAGISFFFFTSFVAANRLPKMSVDRGFNVKFFVYVMPVYLGSLASILMGAIDRVILPALTNLSLSVVYTYSLIIVTVVTAITSPFSCCQKYHRRLRHLIGQRRKSIHRHRWSYSIILPSLPRLVPPYFQNHSWKSLWVEFTPAITWFSRLWFSPIPFFHSGQFLHQYFS